MLIGSRTFTQIYFELLRRPASEEYFQIGSDKEALGFLLENAKKDPQIPLFREVIQFNRCQKVKGGKIVKSIAFCKKN
jgi:hypothetical protein